MDFGFLLYYAMYRLPYSAYKEDVEFWLCITYPPKKHYGRMVESAVLFCVAFIDRLDIPIFLEEPLPK